MGYLVLKLLISALVIVAVSEISKRLPWLGALVASLPLTSILAMVWLYRDTKDIEKVSALSSGILALVIPSLILFALFPVLAKRGFGFAAALTISSFATIVGYAVFYRVLKGIGLA